MKRDIDPLILLLGRDIVKVEYPLESQEGLEEDTYVYIEVRGVCDQGLKETGSKNKFRVLFAVFEEGRLMMAPNELECLKPDKEKCPNCWLEKRKADWEGYPW